MDDGASAAEAVTISLAGGGSVSALLQRVAAPTVVFVCAHGAGAGMTHPFLGSVAAGLAARGVASLRYQFPFMEQKSRRPDRLAVATATVRAAVASAAELLPGVPLLAGGKSFGGRMTSQAQAGEPLPGVRGLVFLGFPLHPAGKPGTDRAAHLAEVEVPMLFLQGDRDALATVELLQPVVAGLGSRATLWLAPMADHSFHVPARSGTTDAAVFGQLLDEIAGWADALVRA